MGVAHSDYFKENRVLLNSQSTQRNRVLLNSQSTQSLLYNQNITFFLCTVNSAYDVDGVDKHQLPTY